MNNIPLWDDLVKGVEEKKALIRGAERLLEKEFIVGWYNMTPEEKAEYQSYPEEVMGIAKANIEEMISVVTGSRSV